MLNFDRILSKFATHCGLHAEGERRCDPTAALNKHIEDITLGATPLADLLPYDYYDDELGIVFNRDGTTGFWFEIHPIVGSNDGIEKNLTLFFNDELPEDFYLQFLIIAGHDVSAIIDSWEGQRIFGGAELAKLTAYRKWFIQNCAKDFASAGDGRLARNFRTFVSCSKKASTSKKSLEILVAFQKKLENKLKTEKMSPKLMKAADLISVGSDLLQMKLEHSNDRNHKARYSKYNNLSDQICSPFTRASVEDNHIAHETTGLESRIFSLKELPKEGFSLAEMVALLGSEDKVIPARFVISYQLASSLGAGGTSNLLAQGYRSIHAAEKDYTRNDIAAKEQAKEWREVLARHKKERFLSESMLVMITAPKANIAIAEESLKSLWNANDWKIVNATDVQLAAMLALLPMAQSWAWQYLSFFKFTGNAFSGDIVAKLPIQGEWKGVPISGVLMMGRRGQLFNFNPFYRIGGGGNYNIALMAPSGAGKSFFLEDLATSMLAQDVAVFIMDIGASYKNIGHLLKSEMIRFNKGNKMSLNPFASLSNSGAVYIKALELIAQNYDIGEIAKITGLSEEKLHALELGKTDTGTHDKETDAIEILEIKGIDEFSNEKTHFVTKDSIIYAKAMLASMCGVGGDIREEAVIERAINIGIATHGTSLDITKLTEILENLKDRRGEPVEGATRLADSLYPYTESGIHGRFFKAGNEASFTEMLTIFEFEELVNDEPLLAVVLQIILMQITMQFLCGDRTRQFMLIVDEAWMIMDFAASFLERFARTVRKYGGSLVVCTQDLSSFSKGYSQKAILESSTWKLIMQQNTDGVASFAKEEGYLPYLDLIRSIRKCSNNKFSEVLFDTNGAKVVGRLVTDPYSTSLYSTESEDFAFLINQEKMGFSKHQAILNLSRKYGALPEVL
jgi:type-IV secretion system protein TraC